MTTNKIKVLLVEDHAVVRNGARMMLATTNDIIVEGEAENVHEARALLKQKKFDVALLDVSLPGINGLEFLKSLRKERSKIPVLIFSMYPEEIYAMRALQLGAAGYLTKNSSIDILSAAIRKVAQGGKYVSAALSERLAGIVGGDRGVSWILCKRNSLMLRHPIAELNSKTIKRSFPVSYWQRPFPADILLC